MYIRIPGELKKKQQCKVGLLCIFSKFSGAAALAAGSDSTV